MAYQYDQVEYDLGSATCTSTGDKLGWAPGYVPHYVRAVSFQVNTAETTTNTVLNFTTQPVGFSNSNITAGDIAILKVLTTHTQGQVVFKDGINEKKLAVGTRLVFNVGTAGATLIGNPHLFLEPSYETPLNVATTIMIPTT